MNLIPHRFRIFIRAGDLEIIRVSFSGFLSYWSSGELIFLSWGNFQGFQTDFKLMMQRKSLLNPHAAPFVPRPRNLPAPRFERDNMVGISDNNEDVGTAGSFQLTGSASVQNIQSVQKFHLSDKPSSELDRACFPDEENEMMNDLDYLITMFPDYAPESLLELLSANHGDLGETLYALELLEYDGDVSQEFPETSEIRNNLVSDCHKSDDDSTR